MPAERPVEKEITVLHVGDVANVAADLSSALGKRVRATLLPVRQAGATWPAPLKMAAAPWRLAEAVRVSRYIRASRPDIVHVHWVPNALGPFLSGRRYVLHAHGDDIRGLGGPRRWLYGLLIRRANTVLVSTPDLLKWVEGEWLPNPVQPQRVTAKESAIIIASRADPSKRRDIPLAAAERLPEGVRVSALEGPDLRNTRVTALAERPRNEFRRLLGRHAVVWGQFGVGALGLTELEAMSAGCTVATWLSDDVIAAYGGSVPVINSRDPAQIAALSVVALASDQGAAVGARAADFVKQWHNPSRVAAQLATIYRSLMPAAGTKGGPGPARPHRSEAG